MTALHALNGPHDPSSAASSPSPDTVNKSLTSKRARSLVENDDYAAFARRILRAYARRIADGDVEALVTMTDLADEIDAVIGQAVTGLRAFGYSWAEIGSRLGITRQAAQQRWGNSA
jgi:5-methylthioribose kinase